MIYVCIPSHDEAGTLGLVLWKIRKVFEELGREYHVLVADDGSSDHTAEVLESYGKVLPLTVLRPGERRGYGPAVESLLRRALELSDRTRRDCAILMHADYVHRPEQLGEIVRRLESGADLVVGQSAGPVGEGRGYRWARRLGAAWLRPATRLAGVRDPLSGFVGLRLATLTAALGETSPALRCDGWAANAELLAQAGAQARRVETFVADERHDLRGRPSRVRPWSMARSLLAARRRVREARADAIARAGGPRPSENRRPRRMSRR